MENANSVAAPDTVRLRAARCSETVKTCAAIRVPNQQDQTIEVLSGVARNQKNSFSRLLDRFSTEEPESRLRHLRHDMPRSCERHAYVSPGRQSRTAWPLVVRYTERNAASAVPT